MKAETFELVIEMRSACIPPVAVREAPGAGKTIIFTPDSFTNSAKGRANIQTFVEELRRLHVRAHGRDVVDGNGSLLKSVVSSCPKWEHLKARAPSFLLSAWSADKHKFSGAFPQYVMKRLGECVPQAFGAGGGKSKNTRELYNLFREIDKAGAPNLEISS